MVRTILISFILCCSAAVYGQTESNAAISSDEAIAIATKHFIKPGKGWDEPGAKLDAEYNYWLVFSQKSTHSDRGSCKRTNGCTIIEIRTIVIDAETGKIVRKERNKDKYPNYE